MYTVTEWIEKKLGLKVNASKTHICRPSKLKYPGFGFCKVKTKWEAIPHKDSIVKFKRKLKACGSRYQWVVTKTCVVRAI